MIRSPSTARARNNPRVPFRLPSLLIWIPLAVALLFSLPARAETPGPANRFAISAAAVVFPSTYNHIVAPGLEVHYLRESSSSSLSYEVALRGEFRSDAIVGGEAGFHWQYPLFATWLRVFGGPDIGCHLFKFAPPKDYLARTGLEVLATGGVFIEVFQHLIANVSFGAGPRVELETGDLLFHYALRASVGVVF